MDQVTTYAHTRCDMGFDWCLCNGDKRLRLPEHAHPPWTGGALSTWRWPFDAKGAWRWR